MPVIASYHARTSNAVIGIGSRPQWVKNRLALFVGVVIALLLVLSSGAWESLGVESGLPPTATSPIEETNSQVLLRPYLQLQEQLHATQLAIEQNRQETRAAAAQNAEALAKGLQSIQEAFSAQQAQNLEAMHKSIRVMVIVVGTVAGMSFFTLLLTTCFQWRMSKGLAEISAALPTALGLGPGFTPAALAATEQSNAPLLGAIPQPKKHSRELGPSPQPALKRHKRSFMSIENRLFPAPGDSLRRRQFRALKVAVIVGLLCAAVLALLFYAVTRGIWGFGYPHGK